MDNSRILVLGATGGTGREVVSQAQRSGRVVTALVRDPSRLSAATDGLRHVQGNVLYDHGALDEAMQSQDAVICALGTGQSFKSGNLIAGAVPRIVAAMEHHGVRRLVFLSAFGVGQSRRDVPLLPRLFMGTLLRRVYQDKAAGEMLLRRSDRDWTIVYPTALTNGPLTGQYRVGERLSLHGFPRVSRADLAAFLLDQVDASTFVRMGVLVTG